MKTPSATSRGRLRGRRPRPGRGSPRPAAARRGDGSGAGTTFLELLVTTAILSILAAAALPIAAASERRADEIQLRRALRQIRQALDTYHVICLQSVGGTAAPSDPTQPGQAQQLRIRVEDDPDQTCWPKDLDVLIEGVETNIPRYEVRFLRRIPKDPFNRDEDEFDQHGWRLRSSTSRPEAELWDRRNVFDVRSGSEYRALNGSRYEDW